jgi:hypothetical protein
MGVELVGLGAESLSDQQPLGAARSALRLSVARDRRAWPEHRLIVRLDLWGRCSSGFPNALGTMAVTFDDVHVGLRRSAAALVDMVVSGNPPRSLTAVSRKCRSPRPDLASPRDQIQLDQSIRENFAANSSANRLRCPRGSFLRDAPETPSEVKMPTQQLPERPWEAIPGILGHAYHSSSMKLQRSPSMSPPGFGWTLTSRGKTHHARLSIFLNIGFTFLNYLARAGACGFSGTTTKSSARLWRLLESGRT